MRKTFCLMAVALAAAGLDAVTVEPVEGNATPRVVAAVKQLKDGDTLRFEKGEYHFFEEGCVLETLSVGGRSWGEKKVVFDFEGRHDVTVDGGGSTFVWHGNVFPFSFRKCRGVTVKNVTARANRPSYVELTIDRYLDDGGCEFVFRPGVAYRVEDGALLFETDLGTFDSRKAIISVHALERMAIHYLFAANETTDRRGLPSSFLNGVAEDLGNGRVRIVNRRQDLPGCLARYPFRVGEPLCFLLNGRERCSLHFAECRDVTVRDVHLQSGDGMGLVSFLNENVTLDGYRVEPREGDHVSITADCLFVVNNRGLVEVKNSTFSWALDDAVNMHGNYLRVASSRDDELELEHIHREYYNFQPHHAGDTVEFTDPVTRDVLGTATVVSVSERADGAAIRVKGLAAAVPKGTLVENLTWLPEVRLHDNVFHDILHVRLSGRGKYVVERNVFRRGIALLVNDLATYWGEAGRTGDMTIRDNLFDSFSARGWNGSFVNVEVDGRGGRDLKIHRGIRIEDNRVKGLPRGVPFVNAPCALDPVIRNNKDALDKDTIACEGAYKGHLQGVATDGNAIFWSFTVKLVKTGLDGRVQAAVDVPNHHGDLCVKDGVVYVAVNLGRFNGENLGISEVWAYAADDLRKVGRWPLPDCGYGAGGLTVADDRFFVIGGLPATHECNVVYEYTSDFTLVKRHELKTGYTLMGIQTAAYEDGRFIFGIYGSAGNPSGSLECPRDLSSFTRRLGPGDVGVLKLDGDCWTGRIKGHGGVLVRSPGYPASETAYVPKRTGKGGYRVFRGKDPGWTDSGYRLQSDGYRPLFRTDPESPNGVFFPKARLNETNAVLPAVEVGGEFCFSAPDLVRAVRRVAETDEGFAVHLNSSAAEVQEALAAMRAEADRLGVHVVE